MNPITSRGVGALGCARAVLFSRTFCDDGNIRILMSSIDTSPGMWLISTWKVARAIKRYNCELSSLVVIKLKLSSDGHCIEQHNARNLGQPQIQYYKIKAKGKSQ